MNGIYGTVKPANINIKSDVEIFYKYSESRSNTESDMTSFSALDVTSCLVKSTLDDGNEILGLFNLKLPVDIFNKKGYYTVYIRPKEYKVTIYDVSVLVSYTDVKGVVLNLKDLSASGFTDSDLTGYRIDYIDTTSTTSTRSEIVRLITSCNRCEPVLVTVSDSYPKTTRYKLVDTSSQLLFCTVTPSTSASFKPNVTPYIGVAGGEIYLTNTKFNPVLMEIELTDYDEETIMNIVAGDQVRNRDEAIITTYNQDKEIYMQHDYYTVKDSLGNALYDVKKKRENIDGSQTYDDLIGE